MRWPFAKRGAIEVDRSDWIDDARWQALIASHGFLTRLDDDRRARLRSLCGAFLDTKAINGAQGLVVDDEIGRAHV